MSLFAIRFPFWAMHLIGADHYKDTMDQLLPAEEFFPDAQALCEQIFDVTAFFGKGSPSRAVYRKTDCRQQA